MLVVGDMDREVVLNEDKRDDRYRQAVVIEHVVAFEW